MTDRNHRPARDPAPQEQQDPETTDSDAVQAQHPRTINLDLADLSAPWIAETPEHMLAVLAFTDSLLALIRDALAINLDEFTQTTERVQQAVEDLNDLGLPASLDAARLSLAGFMGQTDAIRATIGLLARHVDALLQQNRAAEARRAFHDHPMADA